ncbi:UNVERIFIED_CONTAM: hypothetical protein Slati_1085700 [Sesamum latifolium]|uniref:Uncharacterized protein n=1 Tax=Sesamum latifolium TaxID=2727402 RepID=A0AAW2XTZ1_9LAMI
MRAVEECQPPTYWSYTPDKQRLEPVKTTTTTTTTVPTAMVAKTSKPNINNKPKPNNLVVSVRDASRATMINSSSSSYTLPNAHYGNNKDAEVRRKQRIMSYNAYAVEGKVKASIRSSFRWMKNKCSTIVHGY